MAAVPPDKRLRSKEGAMGDFQRLVYVQNGVLKGGDSARSQAVQLCGASMWGDAELSVYSGTGFASVTSFLDAAKSHIGMAEDVLGPDPEGSCDIDLGEATGSEALYSIMKSFGEGWEVLKNTETQDDGTIGESTADPDLVSLLSGNSFNMWLHPDDLVQELELDSAKQLYDDGNFRVSIARTSGGRWYLFEFSSS